MTKITSLLSIRMQIIKSTTYTTLVRRMPLFITKKMRTYTKDQRQSNIRCPRTERCLRHLKLYGMLARLLQRVKVNSSNVLRNQDGSNLLIEL